MTKILIFSTAYFPFVGGAEVAVREITDRINDIEFDMITARMDRKLPKQERIGNINVYRMGFGIAFLDKIILAKFGFLKALKLNKKNNYDITWSIMASQASIAASLLKIFSARGGSALGGNKKIKLVLTLQEGDEEEHLARYVFNIKFLYKILIRPWHLLVFKKADKITAISNYLKERAVKNGVKAPVEIIPNGVDINKFSIFPIPSLSASYGASNFQFSINDFKNSLSIKNDEKVVITVSRLVNKNGLEHLVNAIKLLNVNKTIYKLIICGTGDEEKKLKELATKNDIKDKVLFLGNIDHNELPKYLRISDVFCRPSLSEGLGNVFLEAMSAGIPVIGTPVGGIPDFLEDNKTGWFCEVNNPKSIVEEINYILDERNKETVKRVKENAKKLVTEKYNWEIIAGKMKNVFIN